MNRLDAIAARANAATPGPWVAHTLDDGRHPRTFVSREDGVAVPPKFYVAYLPDMTPEDSRPDAAFLAHARQDIPDLLAVAQAAADTSLQCDDLCAAWAAADERQCSCNRVALRAALDRLTRASDE